MWTWSRRAAADRRRDSGFLLIEVLVTVAVASILLVALIRAFGATWSGITGVREEADAMIVARGVLEASTVRSVLAPGTQQGVAGRFAWAVGIVLDGTAPAASQSRPASSSNPSVVSVANAASDDDDADSDSDNARSAQPWNLYRINVVVTAPGGRRTSLESYKLGRAAQ
jgi:type II secretory pathway pseudopilin PulG